MGVRSFCKPLLFCDLCHHCHVIGQSFDEVYVRCNIVCSCKQTIHHVLQTFDSMEVLINTRFIFWWNIIFIFSCNYIKSLLTTRCIQITDKHEFPEWLELRQKYIQDFHLKWSWITG